MGYKSILGLMAIIVSISGVAHAAPEHCEIEFGGVSVTDTLEQASEIWGAQGLIEQPSPDRLDQGPASLEHVIFATFAAGEEPGEGDYSYRIMKTPAAREISAFHYGASSSAAIMDQRLAQYCPEGEVNIRFEKQCKLPQKEGVSRGTILVYRDPYVPGDCSYNATADGEKLLEMVRQTAAQ